ncbi:MAG: hypothetical protein IT518_05430 [Burkholderiales bacterium]|nr:hypothetical protein [Burkholderiales bacterium]
MFEGPFRPVLALSTGASTPALMASARKIGVHFEFCKGIEASHEVFACGTGSGGIVGCRIRPKHGSGRVVRAFGVGDLSGPGKNRDEEGQEKEGEEIHGRGSVRRVAHEVNKVVFLSVQPRTSEESHMNKLLLALIAGAFTVTAAAQTAAPKPTAKEKQQDVRSTTGAAAAADTATETARQQAANVKASKEVSKMTAAEKNAFIKELNKQMINPENPSGSVSGTAAQQKANTAESKALPKQNIELKTKEGQKAVSKELQQKATK